MFAKRIFIWLNIFTVGKFERYKMVENNNKPLNIPNPTTKKKIIKGSWVNTESCCYKFIRMIPMEER